MDRPRRIVTNPELRVPNAVDLARATIERGSDAILALLERESSLRAVADGEPLVAELRHLAESMTRAAARLFEGQEPSLAVGGAPPPIAPPGLALTAIEARVKRIDDLVNHLVVLQPLARAESSQSLAEVTGTLANLIRATVDLRTLLRRSDAQGG